MQVRSLLRRFFAPHLHVARFGRDLVVLDLLSGQYELLAGAAIGVSMAADRRSITIGDPSAAAALDELQLFAEAMTPAPRTTPPLPTRSAVLASPEPLSTWRSLWIAGGWLYALRHFHGQDFKHLMTMATRRGASRHACSMDRVLSAAAAFDHLSPWIPFQGDCLYRCFVLLHLMGKDAAEVDWVFGVRTWPFLAHCWLQAGDVALTDFAEKLVVFSPIYTA